MSKFGLGLVNHNAQGAFNPKGNHMEIDLSHPEIQAAIKAAVDEQVEGLKAKRDELLGANKDLKSELEMLKGQLDGVDLKAVKELLAKATMDEESRLIAEGKLDEVIQKRTERLRDDYDSKLAAEKERADRAENYANKFRQSVVRSHIMQAAVESGVLKEATGDIAFLAQSQFTLDDNGNAVALDEHGEVIIGKDGKTPLTPKEWVETIRETKPYFWPVAHGSGAQGSGYSGGKKWDDYTEAERASLARTNPDAFKQLQKTQGK
ncbi:hypothetical protein KDV41_09470 [Providencia stuartii]|uniref:hypothetical protein n=1 Tax=Providencia TaxID=586 RepID=UPI0018D543EE|nr:MULTISPECIES: hypothetical protein [Providencia]EMF0919314.1 hypothetical protein [Providencia stuartii]MBQ0458624.1 hypothetical protein [Providencia stuartii]MBQ0695182.1 hypothetical protein [Providencia stuartii]MDT7047112.1 hypothetical protein [Providencia stuartii]WRV51097.1 hypothetical protein VQ573_15755 [Providencia stuartii]